MADLKAQGLTKYGILAPRGFGIGSPLAEGELFCDDQPNLPKRNLFRSNISAGGLWDHISENIRQYQTMDQNLALDKDSAWVQIKRDATGRPIKLTFKDPDAVSASGYTPLPLSKMGLYQDARRASWPVLHEVRVVALPGIPKP